MRRLSLEKFGCDIDAKFPLAIEPLGKQPAPPTLAQLRFDRNPMIGRREYKVIGSLMKSKINPQSVLKHAVMSLACIASIIAAVASTNVTFGDDKADHSKLFAAVDNYLDQRSREFDTIPSERKAKLDKIARYVAKQLKSGQTAKLTFICTHNSRRSHMSQIWAAVAASRYEIQGVETYSGGTEATAFNPRAIAAIERAGLQVAKPDIRTNPRYEVRYRETAAPLICFSKVYNESPNPKEDFCAVMTCSQADTNCPVVKGSASRIAVPFDDPKVADGTPEEASKYDERCEQICREMLYVFSQVKN